MSDERIPPDEILYRRLLPEREHYQLLEDGSLQVKSQAFTDRNMQPSVDRSSLCNHNPAHTQQSPDCCVVSVVTSDVRSIKSVTKNDPKTGTITSHDIDVHPDPLQDNHAHAEIRAAPHIASKTMFRKLRESLARLAKWEIRPPELSQDL